MVRFPKKAAGVNLIIYVGLESAQVECSSTFVAKHSKYYSEGIDKRAACRVMNTHHKAIVWAILADHISEAFKTAYIIHHPRLEGNNSCLIVYPLKNSANMF
ncbi:MAG: hypothetical protein S4CHLAM27_12660 [Chlamydiia bacterium]|nr:hypothetical protein [Chlamydiia bacterium]